MPGTIELSLTAWMVIAAAVGLTVGSFLNVVIFRLPARMKYEWHKDCSELLEQENRLSEEPPGIVFPASHCPQCKTPIKPWHNIPVVGYLMLGGKCHSCKSSISLRYPLIELLTAILTVATVAYFGATIKTILAIILVWGLIALTFIDIDEQLLPDSITLPLIWLGLLVNTQSLFTDIHSAIYGAVGAYLVLWVIFHLFKLLTKKEGMGFGDFKLLSLFGAWFGWQLLPLILILSSITGVIGGLILMFVGKSGIGKAFPFGPYLVLAGLIALFWGGDINQWYLGISGLG